MTETKSDSQHPTDFPRQKMSYKKKNAHKKQWFKDCVESAEDMALNGSNGDHHKMQVLYDLDNDIINEEEMEAVFNPMGLPEATFPTSTKNYPLSVPKIDLLQGEELKRRFDWSVRAKNIGVESSEASKVSEMLMKMIIEELQQESFNEEEFQKRFSKFAKYTKYGYKAKNELTATRILQFLWREQLLQEKFNDSFRDALVGGTECFRIDVEGEEPVLERADPRTIYPIRMGASHKIEDADIIVQITYEPINKIIDTFYDYLTDSEVDELENIYSNKTKSSEGVLGYKHTQPPIYSNLDFGDGPGFSDIGDFSNQLNEVGLPYDDNGNIRVTRARWVGRKKVGILTSFDEQTGDEKETLVSEFHEVDEDMGESIRYLWINEAYEGTKIGLDTFVKLQRRDVQMRHFDNKSKCFLGYVGTLYGRSLMGRMESYQYLYNVYMRRLEMIMAKYKGPIYELDLSKIPDDWEMDKWMYYSDVLGWAVIDNFNESKKGSSTGKLAGSFNQGGRVLDPNIGNYVQQVVMMLQHIEDIMGKIAGVNDQRLGQVENRETVGGVERAVTQSSHITEKWFFVHDETKKRVMAALLDTAKFAWKDGQSRKLNFVLDDMSRQFLEFNPEDIASSEFDLFITNSSRDQELRQHLVQMGHAFMQNGGDMSTIIDIFMSDSITDMRNKLDSANDEIKEREEQMQKSQQEAQQQMAQLTQKQAEEDRQLEYDKLDVDLQKAHLKAETDLQIAGMREENTESVVDNSDDSKLALEERKHVDKMVVERGKLSEMKRSNMAKESIARIKPRVTSK